MFISDFHGGDAASAGDSFRLGHSLLLAADLVTQEEVVALRRLGSEAAVAERASLASKAERTPLDETFLARVRLPVTEHLDRAGVALCDTILLRAIALLKAQQPAMVASLFGDALDEESSCVRNGRLGFSSGEPAVNVYRAPGGGFTPHEDKQSLTVLVSLTDAVSGHFVGGGTAFWSVEARGPKRSGHLHGETAPTIVVHAAAGTALFFTGSVAHAGQAITVGERAVFVASFSPTAISDRLSGELLDNEGVCPRKSARPPADVKAQRLEDQRLVAQKELVRRAMGLRLADRGPQRV